MDFLYFYNEILLWTISPSSILKINNILCGKEPLPQNNEVYYRSYVKHYLILIG